MDPAPVRLPARRGSRASGLRAPTSAAGGAGVPRTGRRARAPPGAPMSPPLPHPHGGASTASGRPRGRSPRVRGHAPAVDEDMMEIQMQRPAARVAAVRKDKANWSTQNTLKLCVMYCNQIDNGNCVMGVMSKSGWNDIIRRYHAATGLLHDKEQFQSRIRQLKGQWQFCNKLRSDTGLGRQPDGGVTSDKEWWDKNTEGKSDLMKFKKGMPAYLAEMDKMFDGVVVDGSTSFVAGQPAPIEVPTSEDEEEEADEEEDPHTDEPDEAMTPASGRTKRGSSTDTTASSPRKRSKSPAVRAMDNNIHQHCRSETEFDGQNLGGEEGCFARRTED